MNICALISGGKDSIFAIHCCRQWGHHVIALANLHPPIDESQAHQTPTNGDFDASIAAQEMADLDSHMFQTIGHSLLPTIASECLQLPLYSAPLVHSSTHTALHYDNSRHEANDEVEDLYQLLLRVKTELPHIQGVCSGAILSHYQRLRVEHVCARLCLHSIAPLWQCNPPSTLLTRMFSECAMQAVLVKVAASGLSPSKDLGQALKSLFERLIKLEQTDCINVCGEGGEYETIVLDCSMFHRRLHIESSKIESDYLHMSNDAGMSGSLRIMSFKTVEKSKDELAAQMNHLSIAADDDAPQHKTNADAALNDAFTRLKQLRITPPAPARPLPPTSQSNAEWRVPDLALLQHLTITSSNPALFPAYTQCTDHSHLSYLSTHACLNASSQALSVQDEAFLTLSYCKRLLQNDHASSVAHVHLYLRDMADFASVNHAYKAVFEQFKPPSRSCVQFDSSQLESTHSEKQSAYSQSRQQQPRLLVDMLAYRTVSEQSLQRSVLHVQSISPWSAACIGPYSQCNVIAGVCFMCGVIGLQPQSMQLATLQDDSSLHGCVKAQIRQMVENTDAILEQVQSSTRRCISVTVYLHSSLHNHADVMETVTSVIESRYNARHCAPVLYVFVDALPAGALIELELVAYQSSLDSHYRSLRLHQPCVRQYQLSHLIGPKPLASAASHTRTLHPVVCNLFGSSIQDMASVCTDLFVVCIRDEEHWRSSQLSCQCYYVPQRISLPQLQQALHDALRMQMSMHFNSTHSTLTMPAVSFVPVTHLKGQSSAESAEVISFFENADAEASGQQPNQAHAFAVQFAFAQTQPPHSDEIVYSEDSSEDQSDDADDADFDDLDDTNHADDEQRDFNSNESSNDENQPQSQSDQSTSNDTSPVKQPTSEKSALTLLQFMSAPLPSMSGTGRLSVEWADVIDDDAAVNETITSADRQADVTDDMPAVDQSACVTEQQADAIAAVDQSIAVDQQIDVVVKVQTDLSVKAALADSPEDGSLVAYTHAAPSSFTRVDVAVSTGGCVNDTVSETDSASTEFAASDSTSSSDSFSDAPSAHALEIVSCDAWTQTDFWTNEDDYASITDEAIEQFDHESMRPICILHQSKLDEELSFVATDTPSLNVIHAPQLLKLLNHMMPSPDHDQKIQSQPLHMLYDGHLVIVRLSHWINSPHCFAAQVGDAAHSEHDADCINQIFQTRLVCALSRRPLIKPSKAALHIGSETVSETTQHETPSRLGVVMQHLAVDRPWSSLLSTHVQSAQPAPTDWPFDQPASSSTSPSPAPQLVKLIDSIVRKQSHSVSESMRLRLASDVKSSVVAHRDLIIDQCQWHQRPLSLQVKLAGIEQPRVVSTAAIRAFIRQ